MEYDLSGIVTKASKDSCDVSFSIDKTTIVLSFGPSVFYSFGIRCEGNMANILEEGTEVDLCYRSSEYPCIVAVWLGEKPDSFSNYSDVSSEDTLAAVYDKVGRVIAVNKDTFIVESDRRKVVISKDVAYRDGRRFDVQTKLEIDEEVTYDAIPCDDDPSGVSHRATCAWIGLSPGLVQRFSLDVPGERDELVEVMTKHCVYGVVVAIPSEVLALVEVEFESSLFKVMIFRNSFKPACERIQDKVAVGNHLCLRLSSRYIFGGRRQLFAAIVVVDMDESTDKQSVDFEESFKDDSSLKDVPSLGNVSSCLENVSNCLKDLSNDNDNTVVLYSNPPLIGVISQNSCDSGYISYGSLKIFVDRDNFYLDGHKGSVADFMLFVATGNKVVKFEAVPSTMREFSHEATCVWVGKKPRFMKVVSSLPSPNHGLLEEKGKFFYGVVSKMCLPEWAIVDIPSESTTACIHVSQCASRSWYASQDNFCDEIGLISSYVGLKDCVQFKVERLEGVLYAREVTVVRSLSRVFSEDGTFRTSVTRLKKADEMLASIVVKARKAGLKKSGSKKSGSKKGAAKKAFYSEVAKMTVTKLAAGGILAAATAGKAAVVNGSARNASTQKASGKNASTQKASGKNASTQKASGKNASTQKANGKNTSTQKANRKNTSTQNASGKNASTQSASGKNASTQSTSGKNASTQKASGKNSSTQKASGKNASTQKASGKNTSTQKASGKNTSTQKENGKNTSTQNASGKDASTQKASGKNASTQSASGKNASTQKASGKNSSTQKASGKNASTQKASGKNASTQKASGKNASIQKASGKNAATQRNTDKMRNMASIQVAPDKRAAFKSETKNNSGAQKASGKKAASKRATASKISNHKSEVILTRQRPCDKGEKPA